MDRDLARGVRRGQKEDGLQQSPHSVWRVEKRRFELDRAKEALQATWVGIPVVQ
jgi:hypothetical protein